MIDAEAFGKQMGAIVREACAPLIKRIEELEARAAIKGDTGEQGPPGKDAEPLDVADVVRELIACEEIVPILSMQAAEAVAKHFESNPVQHGKDGAPGLPGDRGEKGDAGSDGIGLAGAMIDRGGELVITTTKGDAIKLGSVVGKDGTPGKDGADLSDVSIDYDGERAVTIKAKGGEVAKTYTLPVPMDKGYWCDGDSAQKGDIKTHDGNAWIALCDTKAKPSHDTKTEWRLFARKGRDGNDGRPGRDLGPLPAVKLNGNG